MKITLGISKLHTFDTAKACCIITQTVLTKMQALRSDSADASERGTSGKTGPGVRL